MPSFYGQPVNYTGKYKYLLGWNRCPECGRALCYPDSKQCSPETHKKYADELKALYPHTGDPEKYIYELLAEAAHA